MLTPDDMRQKLREAVEKAGSQKAWANANDVSAQYVCDALQGRREIGESIASAFGVRAAHLLRQDSKTVGSASA